MRRALLAALALITISCGGPDETLLADVPGTPPTASQSQVLVVTPPSEEPLPPPEAQKLYAAPLEVRLHARQRPAEERIFYLVDVNVPPPGLPAPPCPSCR